MNVLKSVGLALLFLVCLTVVGQAQVPAPYSLYGRPAAATPPSWFYDPYTSGLGPCPQRYRGELRCSETIEPSYGQPNYWSR